MFKMFITTNFANMTWGDFEENTSPAAERCRMNQEDFLKELTDINSN